MKRILVVISFSLVSLFVALSTVARAEQVVTCDDVRRIINTPSGITYTVIITATGAGSYRIVSGTQVMAGPQSSPIFPAARLPFLRAYWAEVAPTDSGPWVTSDKCWLRPWYAVTLDTFGPTVTPAAVGQELAEPQGIPVVGIFLVVVVAACLLTAVIVIDHRRNR